MPRLPPHGCQCATEALTGHPCDDVPTGTLKSILKSAGFGDEAMSQKYAVIFEKAESNWAAYVPDFAGMHHHGKDS